MGPLCAGKWTQVVRHLLRRCLFSSSLCCVTQLVYSPMYSHSKSFRCPRCPEVCSDNLALENHVVNHFAEQLDQVSIASKYRCKNFSRQTENRTIQAMPQVAPYTCSKCRRDFKEKDGLRRHVAFAHGLLYQLTTLTRLLLKLFKSWFSSPH